MNGLDPQGIADVRNLILRLSKEEKKTIMVSSHLLSEMELIADSMLIIDKGKKIVEGKMTDLFAPSETIVELKTNDVARAYEKIQMIANYMLNNDKEKKIVEGKMTDLFAPSETIVELKTNDVARK